MKTIFINGSKMFTGNDKELEKYLIQLHKNREETIKALTGVKKLYKPAKGNNQRPKGMEVYFSCFKTPEQLEKIKIEIL